MRGPEPPPERLDPSAAPDWLTPLLVGSAELDVTELSRLNQPQPGVTPRRHAGVLVLFGETDEGGPDLLFQERADTLTNHAGQVSFPGGGLEAQDDDLVTTALREAAEETGLDPAGVVPFAIWPALWVPVSNFGVSPVLAWWREPSPVAVVDPAEVASVHEVPISALADPVNRISCLHPSGFTGPAFTVGDLYIWGFTAGLLDKLLLLGGWHRDWDPSVVVPLPDRLVEAAWRSEGRRPEDVRRLTAIEHDLGQAQGDKSEGME